MIGGTDPGRFVPTYMIFGESGHRQKQAGPGLRPPRSLYHHAKRPGRAELHEVLAGSIQFARPELSTVFERWLGRDSAYPVKASDPAERER